MNFKEWAEQVVIVVDEVPEDEVFLVTSDAFEPPPGEDPEEWLSKRVAKIKFNVTSQEIHRI